ncbi:hypothetical protein ILUMI_21945 [Ignelater luminosus]|uniref:Uncharacterized protein n=1 Tax=Ignelater luminosus TaxID=2038154 RepID=A0A8K0CBI1_IGNLU|nr:hypothetical protein ILUMI_21945 [Ignelater luminosus]
MIRSHCVIKTQEKYWALYSKVGEIRKLDTEWILINIKGKGKVANSVLVKTGSLYRTNDPTKRFETQLKPRKRLEQVTLTELPLGRRIKKKLDSLKKLLISLPGENWNIDPELG